MFSIAPFVATQPNMPVAMQRLTDDQYAMLVEDLLVASDDCVPL